MDTDTLERVASLLHSAYPQLSKNVAMVGHLSRHGHEVDARNLLLAVVHRLDNDAPIQSGPHEVALRLLRQLRRDLKP